SCSSLKKSALQSNGTDYSQRHLLLRDEGLSQLSYVNLAHPDKNWYTPVPPGRDLQLVGNGLVLIGTGNGYEERDINTGKKLFELSSFKGTVSARRLRNGNTLLTGIDWQDKKGVSMVEVNKAGEIKRRLHYPSYSYVRLVRESPVGTYLISADDTVFESDTTSTILWKVQLKGMDKPHAWQALRLGTGQTVVSTGFLKTLQVFSKEGLLQKTISGTDDVHPHFFAGFQVMNNGNYVVTNWQGHGDKFGSSGIQLLEFTPEGKLAWSWKQDPQKFSSLQGVIVLDGLDLRRLHVENDAGVLTPVP
ncbi:MAG TPA: hypothetical protein VM935_10995, partial [Chitinophagaceae bacterium]|nr:hypothetical protein [Chitinophagaceae bacterium]